MRTIVNRYYEDSGEPKLVRKAVDQARSKEEHFNAEAEIDGGSTFSILRYVCCWKTANYQSLVEL